MADKISPAEKFDQANKNFKKVFRSRFDKPLGSKYKYLHHWTLQKSEYLLNDAKCYTGNKKVYKRGAIVNVDFGVNVGTELSGNHFAIILNKKDSKSNDKLTVIPLTSHEHSHTIKLSNTIKESSMDEFLKNINIAMVSLYCVLFLQYELLSSIGKKPNKTPLETLSDLFTKRERPDDIKFIRDIVDNIIRNKEEAINYLKENTDLYDDDNDADPTSSESIEKLFSMIQQFNISYNRYKLYDKTTYAKAVDITTISKARLRRINRYDPIGKITVSNDILDAIDTEIKALFLHEI